MNITKVIEVNFILKVNAPKNLENIVHLIYTDNFVCAEDLARQAFELDMNNLKLKHPSQGDFNKYYEEDGIMVYRDLIHIERNPIIFNTKVEVVPRTMYRAICDPEL